MTTSYPTTTETMTDFLPGPPPRTDPGRRGLLGRLWPDLLYAITAFPLGVAAFVLTVTGIALGFGTLVVWVGVPVLVATLLLASALARAERWRLRVLQDRDAPRGAYLASAGERPVRRMTTVLRDPQRWLDAVWGLVSIVTGTAIFVVTVTWFALALGGLTYWFWQVWLPRDNENETLASLVGLGNGPLADSLLNLAIGLVAALSLPWVARGCAWLHASLADVLLNSRGELSAQVRQAHGARAAAQQAEAVSLRRLERDIHDGPQQRLVRLTMDLGRVKRQLATDPRLAARTVDEALQQARDTLDELRALSRGIAPPLLVDRGLGVALDELVVRSAVPVEMTHVLPPGLPPHMETAVYFTVSEALTNVAKHSGAERAVVRVTPDAGTLVVQVVDHGVGGAHPGKGQGLAGLAQRLAAVDGHLTVDSPVGGPTTLTARVPLR